MKKKDKLAIQGGKSAISQSLRNEIPAWPIIDKETGELLKQIYLSGKWSFNETYEQRFCSEFAASHSAKYGVFMLNGTVTLECSLAAVGVKKGDEVIVPALTWMATAMAVLYNNAVPVFVDIEPDTLCLNPNKVKKAITKKTKAIIPVHLYGSMADMEKLMNIAREHGLPVIEDCAHAHGGVWNGKGVGSIGDIGSFSMQQSKTLTSGEGGMCITNNENLYEKLFRLKHIGYDLRGEQGAANSGPPTGLICHNYRGTEFQAAVLLGGLKHLHLQTKLRDANAKKLANLIDKDAGVKIQRRGRLADLQGYYSLVLLSDPKKRKKMSLPDFIAALSAEGLAVGPTYGPVYKHILWNVPKSKFKLAEAGCPATEYTCENVALVIPHTWLLGNDDLIHAMAKAINKVALNA